MTGAFGPGAVALSGLAARLLGWRPDHFWNATPAELTAALAPPGTAVPGIDRAELNRLMDMDDG